MPDIESSRRLLLHTADLAATSLFLVAQLACAYYSLVIVLIGGSMGTDSCGISTDHPCDWTTIKVAILIALPTIAISVIGSVIMSVRRICRNRVAWPVPLVALALQIVAIVVFCHVLEGAT